MIPDSGKAQCAVCGRTARYASKGGAPRLAGHNFPEGHKFEGAYCNGSTSLVTADGAKNGVHYTARAI